MKRSQDDGLFYAVAMLINGTIFGVIMVDKRLDTMWSGYAVKIVAVIILVAVTVAAIRAMRRM